ncbi:MAG: hypothetical protein ACRELY_31430 [Polyangiaceae bacterium]
MRRSNVVRRLHALSGVVPLGAFLVEHLWATAAAMKSRDAFDARVLWLDRWRAGLAFEIVFILAPLAFHALYGVVLAFDKTEKEDAYPYPQNRFRFLLRASGIASLAFIAWHMWELPIARMLGRVPVHGLFDLASMHLSSTLRGVPWRAIGYFLGLFVTIFHFAYGLVSFSFSRRPDDAIALRRTTFRVAAFASLLFLVGGATILSLATGWPKAHEAPIPAAAKCPP